MKAWIDTMMTRAIACLFVLGLAADTATQTGAEDSAAWNACLATPGRACVLRAAAEVARAIPVRNNDFDETASILSRISDAQSAAGLSAEAAATTDEALRIATPLKSTYAHDDALRKIAGVLARVGRFGEAVDAAGSIRNTYFQPEAIGDIALAEWHAGRLDDALQRGRAIEGLRSRVLVMRRVAWDLGADAVARGEDGKIVALLTDVQTIEQQNPLPRSCRGHCHPSQFPPALAIIAQAQARAGRIDDAMQTVQLVADPRERTQTFALIAADLAQVGAMASALKVARAADDREPVLASILDLRPVPVYVASEDIAHSSVPAEAPEATLDVVAAFTDTKQRAIALGIVAMAFANAGRPAEAADMSAGIDGKPGHVAWRTIAEAQLKAGLTAQSNASFDRAVQVALSLDPNDWLLEQIAASQAEAGQIDEALHVAGLIRGEHRYALRAIAKAQARAGRMAEATQNAHALVLRGEIIPPGLGVVAEALAEVGRIDEAIAASTIEDNVQWRSDLLARIARARVAAGRINEAKQVTRYVTEGPDRAAALTAIAAAQVKAGLTADAMATFTEAMRIAQAIPFKNRSADALIAIAASLP